MKNCREIQAELSAYIDNELPSSKRATVADHVQECGDCRQRLEELKTLTAGVVALPQLQPPPGFLAAVRRKIAGDLDPRAKGWQDYLLRPLWLKIPLESAAIIAIVFLVMQFGRPVRAPLPSRNETMPAERSAAAPVAAATEKLAPNRLVGSASPSAASGPQTKAPRYIMVLLARNLDDAQREVRGLVDAVNGRILLPDKNAMDRFSVELPAANLEKFRSGLQSAKLLKGTSESTAANELVRDAGAAKKDDSESVIVVQIQISAPAD